MVPHMNNSLLNASKYMIWRKRFILLSSYFLSSTANLNKNSFTLSNHLVAKKLSTSATVGWFLFLKCFRWVPLPDSAPSLSATLFWTRWWFQWKLRNKIFRLKWNFWKDINIVAFWTWPNEVNSSQKNWFMWSELIFFDQNWFIVTRNFSFGENDFF